MLQLSACSKWVGIEYFIFRIQICWKILVIRSRILRGTRSRETAPYFQPTHLPGHPLLVITRRFPFVFNPLDYWVPKLSKTKEADKKVFSTLHTFQTSINSGCQILRKNHLKIVLFYTQNPFLSINSSKITEIVLEFFAWTQNTEIQGFLM